MKISEQTQTTLVAVGIFGTVAALGITLFVLGILGTFGKLNISPLGNRWLITSGTLILSPFLFALPNCFPKCCCDAYGIYVCFRC